MKVFDKPFVPGIRDDARKSNASSHSEVGLEKAKKSHGDQKKLPDK
jgi:hypothetical protein